MFSNSNMSLGSKLLLITLVAAALISFFWVRHLKRRTIILSGAVITQSADPRKQLPIAGVRVTATDGVFVAQSASDSSGLFTVTLRRRILRGQLVTLRFRHADYQPLDLPVGDARKTDAQRIYVAALSPLSRPQSQPDNRPRQTISNIVVRYSIKTRTEANIGSAVRAFEAVNRGNVLCGNHVPCSPDGKWKGSVGSVSLDAGVGNEFRNARASCIAGPCPFTRIDTEGLERDGQVITVSAISWSDTATFLVEAEVVHPMLTDVVRNLYPVIFGNALNFTLPPAAEGISIEAEVNGERIIYPLGPALILSWAECNARINPDQTRVYRCELKSGYQLPPGSGSG
jgi:hypothetical protein